MFIGRIKAHQVLSILLCLFITLGISSTYAANKEDILESKILKIGKEAPVFVAKNLEGADF